MSLRDSKTKNLIANEKLTYIEDLDAEEGTISGNLENNDMISYIELPQVEPGMYELTVAVDKGMFLPRKGIKTCLNFDITVEHVAVRGASEENRYEVVSVMP